MYVQAIPGTSSPMIYSAVVGAGGASGTPQLVQWKTTTSGHQPGMSVCLSVSHLCSNSTMCFVFDKVLFQEELCVSVNTE